MDVLDVAALIASATAKRAKHPEVALLALVAAWRATRAPELADAIDRVGRAVPRRALGGGSLKAQTARWNEVAADADPLDVPRLAAALASGRAQSAALRLEALAAFPHDPRLARPLAEFLTTPPYADGTAMTRATERAATLLVELADRRAIAILEPHARHAPTIARLRAAADAATRSLDPAARIALAALDRELASTRSGEELLAAIYADPDDDGPREVYADWLLQQPEPRATLHGELIALQLRAGREPLDEIAGARERELITKLSRDLAGPIAKVTKSRVFARGFLVCCTLEPKNTRSLISASTAAEWQTVEELDLRWSQYASVNLLMQPAMRHIKRVRGLQLDALAALAAHPRGQTLELVGLRLPIEAVDEALAQLAALGALQALAIETAMPPGVLAALWRGPLAARLERLELVAEEAITRAAVGDYLPRAEATAIREVALYRPWQTRHPSLRAIRASPGEIWDIVTQPDPGRVT